MYKVKDAADQLGVTRVEIFEILLSQRELFDPYVVKNNSITYISDEGMSLLKKVLSPEEESSPEEEATLEEETAEASAYEEESLLEEPDSTIEGVEAIGEAGHAEEALEPLIELEDSMEGVLLEDEEESEDQIFDLEALSDNFFNTLTDNPSVSKIESEDLLVGQWLKEIQTEDDQSMQMDMRLKEIRSQVTSLRNKILVLDSEIKRKDEAIKHYHEIMKDDLRWLEDMERKVQLIVKSHLENENRTNQEQPEEVLEEEKGNFFKFFKR